MNLPRLIFDKLMPSSRSGEQATLRTKILTILEDQGVTGREHLLKKLQVDKNTLQNALDKLQEEGLLQITAHGGAVLRQYSEERPFDQRFSTDEELKQRLAEFAVERHCPRSGNISAHGSSSVIQMISFLHGRRVRVHTNSLLFASLARDAGLDCLVEVSGGRLRFVSGNFVGARALAYFQETSCQVAFVGTHGISHELAFTDPIAEEVAIKEAMIRKAEKVVVLADNTKFGSGSLLTAAQPEDVDVVITDRRANPAMLEALRGRGVQVELVDGK
ncbi:MAG: hypothetical protein GVY10_05270 [Verrucomicrobia bacterium]|nr:hypothetical protein [Verrucomicrobiota bacterium]